MNGGDARSGTAARPGLDHEQAVALLPWLVNESLDAVEMIFDLEEKFDISIPYNANTNNPRTEFETVDDVVKAIEKLVADSKS